MDSLIAKAKEKRIKHLSALLEQLRAVDGSHDFKQLELQTSVICDLDKIKEISEGAFEKGSHIYFITVDSSKAETAVQS